MIVGLATHSRVVSAGFGSYGAAMSIYYHFLARGRDVVYPKDGHGDRARNSGQIVSECGRTVSAMPRERVERL